MRYMLVVLGLLYGSVFAFGSDHIDGPKTEKNEISDLSDLFVFPTNNGSSLAIILNTYPVVTSFNRFSDRIGYGIVIRKVGLPDNGAQSGFITSDEVRIDCSFAGDGLLGGSMTCQADGGQSATVKMDEQSESGDFRLFFGRRSDPFFFDGKWSRLATAKCHLSNPSNENSMSNLNVLSISIEFEIAKIFGAETTLFGVAGEAYVRNPDGTRGNRLDRIGRPEITNVSLVAHGEEEDLRDDYNGEEPFSLADANMARYRSRIEKNIRYYDQLDSVINWEQAEIARLANVLTDDFLVVDAAKNCEKNSYLEIERAMLATQQHQSCGGRKLTDDVMDRIYTIYINNDQGDPIGDGVNQPHKLISSKFPYLAEPASGPRSIAATGLGRAAIKLSRWLSLLPRNSGPCQKN